MFAKSNSRLIFARTSFKEDEPRVTPGLAHPLSQMSELIDKGIPISPSSLEGSYFDGDLDVTDVDPIHSRFFDINDAYNLENDAHRELSKSKLKMTDVNPK